MKLMNLFGSMSMFASNSGGSLGDWLSEKFVPWIAKVADIVLNAVMGFFLIIIQFMLRIVDFLQFFVGKLAGIDTWSSKADLATTRLDQMDVLFRFLLSDSVITVFIAIAGFSIVLLIIFTIMAIVKADYTAAIEGDKNDGSKAGVLKKAGQSLFLLFIVPFVLIFGIIASNAVLASLNKALKGEQSLSIGGQIYSVSSYEANWYRKYALSNKRIAVSFGDEIIDPVFVPEKGEWAVGGIVVVDGIEYFVAPVGYKSEGTSVYWEADRSDGSLYGVNTSIYNTKIITNYDAIATSATGNGALPDLTVDGNQQVYKTNTFGIYDLGYMDSSEEQGRPQIVKAVYNSWGYNSSIFANNKMKYGYNTVSFESSVSASTDNPKTLSGKTKTVVNYTNNTTNWAYDRNFVSIRDEYFVMADFIDYAVEHTMKFYFVNSANANIVWNSNASVGATEINGNYLVGGTASNPDSFIVEYSSGVNRIYDANNTGSELAGATFIVCTKVGDSYVPITQAENSTSGFVSSYLAENYRGVIVARGIFDTDGNPTAISETTEVDNNKTTYYSIVGNGGAISGNSDSLSGTLGIFQFASGNIVPKDASGNSVKGGNSIAFSHIKVDNIYIENGLQYIELHFYNNIGTVGDTAYIYVFSATVIGSLFGNGYTSSLFNASTTFLVGGVVYSATPTNITNIVKNISFGREYVDTKLTFDFAFGYDRTVEDAGFFNSASWYSRFKLGNRYITDGEDNVYSLVSGSAYLDYNFSKSTGIGVRNLYRLGDLNIIILVFATVLIFSVLMQAIWGLVNRIYQIVLLFIVYPGFVSTIPIDNGDRFKGWKDKLIGNVFGAYGVILGLNFFFILAPVVREATNIFSQEDIPASLSTMAFFGNADFLNKVVYLLFLLVLFTLIKTMPSFISSLIKSGDVYDEGGKVREGVQGAVKQVGNTISGKAAIDKTKEFATLAGNFIPGKALFTDTKLGQKINPVNLAKNAWAKNRAEKNKPSTDKVDTSVKDLEAQLGKETDPAKKAALAQQLEMAKMKQTMAHQGLGYTDDQAYLKGKKAAEKDAKAAAKLASRTERQNAKNSRASERAENRKANADKAGIAIDKINKKEDADLEKLMAKAEKKPLFMSERRFARRKASYEAKIDDVQKRAEIERQKVENQFEKRISRAQHRQDFVDTAKGKVNAAKSSVKNAADFVGKKISNAISELGQAAQGAAQATATIAKLAVRPLKEKIDRSLESGLLKKIKDSGAKIGEGVKKVAKSTGDALKTYGTYLNDSLVGSGFHKNSKGETEMTKLAKVRRIATAKTAREYISYAFGKEEDKTGYKNVRHEEERTNKLATKISELRKTGDLYKERIEKAGGEVPQLHGVLKNARLHQKALKAELKDANAKAFDSINATKLVKDKKEFEQKLKDKQDIFNSIKNGERLSEQIGYTLSELKSKIKNDVQKNVGEKYRQVAQSIANEQAEKFAADSSLFAIDPKVLRSIAESKSQKSLSKKEIDALTKTGVAYDEIKTRMENSEKEAREKALKDIASKINEKTGKDLDSSTIGELIDVRTENEKLSRFSKMRKDVRSNDETFAHTINDYVKTGTKAEVKTDINETREISLALARDIVQKKKDLLKKAQKDYTGVQRAEEVAKAKEELRKAYEKKNEVLSEYSKQYLRSSKANERKEITRQKKQKYGQKYNEQGRKLDDIRRKLDE